MYGWERLVLLRHLLDEGLTKAAIAERLGVSRRVIYYWIETGQLDRDVTTPLPPRARRKRPPKLAPYHAIIQARLASYPELSAVRLFEECRAAGYAGGLSQRQLYVRHARPRPPVEPVIRFETAPGIQAQVDFAEVRFPWGKRSALLVVLGHSRLLWLAFYPRQTMQTVIRGLEAAFTTFGGVPRECLFDQMRSVILGDERLTGGRLLENPEFLRFAAHWDFRIRACRPYRAQTKGKVERPIHYVRWNFLYGREFLGDADLAAQAEGWLSGTANQREHGTTHEAPQRRFEREERATLLPLARRPYQSLGLTPERLPARPSTRRALTPPLVAVERRALRVYQGLLEEASV